MSRRTGPAEIAVQLVMARSEAHCEAPDCGKYLSGNRGYEWSLHHRRARGMGGTRRPESNQPSNLLAICGSAVTGCHGRIEASRVWAVDLGLLVPSWADPLSTPVDCRHGRVLLDDAGTWEYAVTV